MWGSHGRHRVEAPAQHTGSMKTFAFVFGLLVTGLLVYGAYWLLFRVLMQVVYPPLADVPFLVFFAISFAAGMATTLVFSRQ